MLNVKGASARGDRCPQDGSYRSLLTEAGEPMDAEGRLGKGCLAGLHASHAFQQKPSLPSQSNDGSGQADCEHFWGRASGSNATGSRQFLPPFPQSLRPSSPPIFPARRYVPQANIPTVTVCTLPDSASLFSHSLQISLPAKKPGSQMA